MKGDIELFDVSGYLHSPIGSSWGSKTRSMFPVSGMDFLLRKITAELRLGSNVALAFDSFNKRHGHPKDGYKANRTRKPEVVAQSEFLYRHLMKLGVACYRGVYEADDYIYSLCESLNTPELGYSVITINSSDYDLCHNIDESHVVFKTINTLANNVNSATFSSVLRTQWEDEPVLFNTISAAKVFCGDKSDNIPRFIAKDGTKGIEYYRAFSNIVRTQLYDKPSAVKRHRKILESFINQVITNTEDLAVLKSRMDRIYPKDARVNGQPLKSSGFADIDMQGLCDLCKVIGCSSGVYSLSKLGINPQSEDELKSLSDDLYKFGLDYTNGVFQADMNINIKTLSSFSNTLNIGDF